MFDTWEDDQPCGTVPESEEAASRVGGSERAMKKPAAPASKRRTEIRTTCNQWDQKGRFPGPWGGSFPSLFSSSKGLSWERGKYDDG